MTTLEKLIAKKETFEKMRADIAAEKFGEEIKYDGYEEYSNGIIEIR